MKLSYLKVFALLGTVLSLAACGSNNYMTKYTLEAAAITQNTSQHSGSLLISETLSNNVLDRSSMLYQDNDNTLMPYQKSEWVNTPAKLITPILLAHFTKANMFEHVISEPISAQSDYRLDTQLLDFYQDVRAGHNQVKVVMSVTLVDVKTQEIMMSQRYEKLSDVSKLNASSAVVAYNLVLSQILTQMTADVDRTLRMKN